MLSADLLYRPGIDDAVTGGEGGIGGLGVDGLCQLNDTADQMGQTGKVLFFHPHFLKGEENALQGILFFSQSAMGLKNPVQGLILDLLGSLFVVEEGRAVFQVRNELFGQALFLVFMTQKVVTQHLLVADGTGKILGFHFPGGEQGFHGDVTVQNL